MNRASICGRLTADPEVRYSGDTAIASFTIAVDRMKKKDGTRETDFIRCKAFGNLANVAERFLLKGNRAIVEGRIETGSYTDREGRKVYTTEVNADRIEVIDWPEERSPW